MSRPAFRKTFARFTTPLLVSISFILAVSALSAGHGLLPLSRHPTSSPPSSNTRTQAVDAPETYSKKGFALRHVIHHGAGHPGPRARRLNVTAERAVHATATGIFGPFFIKTTSITIDKAAVLPRDAQYPLSPIYMSEDILGPDVQDKDTVVNFSIMSEDAYHPDQWDPEWEIVDDKYNTSIPFGWEASGIQGHVFSDTSNSTVIIAIKGTTVAMFAGNGTSMSDKDNDNLFGSCCCGQGGAYMWHQACDCKTGTYTCDNTCVKDELKKPDRYFEAILELYDEVIKLYPTANIITTGHSLGGVLASLIGLYHGVPSITFEAYPQALAASRLGLPTAGEISPQRKNTGGFHFGHTADPIYTGTCNGASSFCSIAGYAFETTCFTGKRCVYDVVKDWGWRASTSYHKLNYSIENVYMKYEKAAPCEEEAVDCVDCYLWKFEDGTHTKPATTSTTISTSTRTRTQTCKTPGWWGCQDATTTSTATSSSDITTTTVTSTCKTVSIASAKSSSLTDTSYSPDGSAVTTRRPPQRLLSQPARLQQQLQPQLVQAKAGLVAVLIRLR
jgi:lipase ATG15